MDATRWSSAAALCAIVLGAACGGAQLTPGEARPFEPEQGWVVLGFDAERTVSYVELCPQRSNAACVGAGPFQSVDDIAVLAVERGPWCVSRILTETSAMGGTIHPDAGSLCVTAVSDRTRYPGHYVLRWQASSTASELVSLSVADHTDRVEAIRARDYPHVAAVDGAHR